jgi:hypothetical protein
MKHVPIKLWHDAELVEQDSQSADKTACSTDEHRLGESWCQRVRRNHELGCGNRRAHRHDFKIASRVRWIRNFRARNAYAG